MFAAINHQAIFLIETSVFWLHVCESCLLPPEVQEGGVALLSELLVLLALHAPHPLHHLFAQLHGRRQRFGVTTQDVAKVDVEELP